MFAHGNINSTYEQTSPLALLYYMCNKFITTTTINYSGWWVGELNNKISERSIKPQLFKEEE